ncbi:hypothetical protein CRUP_006351 [Coryphaenoides rupestris]|nr:hypothetical protein CRUP_006351 [Coryphaenoides rupestris]
MVLLSASTLTSLGGTSSRRGSGETSIAVDNEASIREIKEIHELKDHIQDVESKYMQNLKEVKKHGIVLGPDRTINGDIVDPATDGSSESGSRLGPDSQVSPTEGNSSMLAAAAMSRKVPVDGDRGVDDGQAVTMAPGAPGVRVLGIACVLGNTTVGERLREHPARPQGLQQAGEQLRDKRL